MASAQIVAGVGDFAVFGNEFEAETGIDIVAVADIPNTAGQGAFFKVLRGRAVVGNVACPVVAAVVARLADTGGQRGFVFVHVPNDRADVAFVEEVVIVVGDAAADSVFGVVANLMCQQFEEKTVQKSYLAIVRGYLQGKGQIDYPLKIQLDKIADKFAQEDKAPQEAVTDYESLNIVEMPYAVGRYQTTRYSLVKLIPQTGRKHQLRRHMKHIFHPILGDTQYGDLHQNRALTEYSGCQRLFLHADTLIFEHPIHFTKIEIKAGLDEQWKRVMELFNWSI